jgi:uncharacterized membrane protein YqhA
VPGSTQRDEEQAMHPAEWFFEKALWKCRLLVLVAVVASAALALGLFYISTVDAIYLLGNLGTYASPGLDDAARAALRDTAVGGVVKTVDGYIIAAILLVFAFGMYELFINKIDEAVGSEQAPRLLQIAGLDDLKDRLAKLILLVLVIEFFQYALKLKFSSPVDLVYLAVGVLCLGGALYLSGPRSGRGKG